MGNAAFFVGATFGMNLETLIMLGALGAGVALFLFILVLFGTNAAVERDLSGRLGRYSAQAEPGGRLARMPFLRRFVAGAEDVARRRGLLDVLETALAQANIPLRAGEAIASMIGISVVVGVLVGIWMQSLVGALIGAGLTMAVAAVLVQSIAARERKKFESQLPDTLNLISTSLRAGYSLLQAVEAVGGEAPQPTSREFGRAMSETRLGRSPVDALKDVADRMQSVDFDWAVLAISIQREVGGNLAEVLQTAAETMMQRNRLRREMHALTAEGRISALVLGGLPFFIFGFLFVTRREYIQPMLESTMGLVVLIGSVSWVLVGIYWLARIVKVDV
jgi:tight adherence protein B